MIEKQITVINKLGLHARAAAKLAKLCGHFSSTINIGTSPSMVDGKSVMSLMLLAASRGTELTVRCDGRDENSAMDEIEQLINNRFDEDE